MKKTISVILCLITCFLILTLSTPVAFAASYSGSCSENIVWSLNTSDGTLTISGTGAMNDYSLSSVPGWDRYQNYVKSVVFADDITSVGAYTFYNGGNGYKYKKLTSVDLGSVETIGEYAFRGCAFINSITNASSVKAIEDYAFLSCSAIADFPFSSIITIGNGAFNNCAGLSDFTFPTTIKTIGSAAFENCDSLTSITIPTSLTSVGDRAFAGCDGVTNVYFNSNSLSTVGNGVFSDTGVQSGATLTIGNNIGSIPVGMFSYFGRLTTVLGGANVSTINDDAFAHTGLTSFNVAAETSTISASAFADTQSLTAFTVDSDSQDYSANSAGILLNRYGTQLVRYPGGKTATNYTIPSSIKTIAEGALRESKYLKALVVPSSITTIPANCCKNCPALQTLSLASTVKTIGIYAFQNCDVLYSVSMNGVQTISNYAFAECESLPNLVTPSSLTSIGNFAFFGCTAMTQVSLTSGITSIGAYAFYNCLSLATVSVPTTVTTINEGAFSFCSSLTSVTLSEGLNTIGDYAFLSCSALLSLTIPSTIRSMGKYCAGFDYKTGSKPNFSVTKVSGFVLYGTSGTQANTYATNNSITFQTTGAEEEIVLVDTDTPVEQNEPAAEAVGIFDFFGNLKLADLMIRFVELFKIIYSILVLF